MKPTLLLAIVVSCCIAIGCGKGTPDTPASSMTTEGKTAVDALKKLKIKTSVGINYRDYSSAVADALFPVTEYLKSPQGTKDNETNKAIRVAANDFLVASAVWTAKVDGTYLKEKPEYGRYGSLSVKVSMEYRGSYTDNKDWLEPDRAIQMIWSHASEQLATLDR